MHLPGGPVDASAGVVQLMQVIGVVQLMQVIGASALAGYPVTR
jgi:hypothetical protein